VCARVYPSSCLEELTSRLTYEACAVLCVFVVNTHLLRLTGALKAFVTTTPTEGGSIMRVRTWVDGRVASSFWMPWLAWVLTGISASQLQADIMILCNKIRQKKPILQPFDGPYNRTNAWLKQFYSASSTAVNECRGYKNDW
jgi:hypothetical protein